MNAQDLLSILGGAGAGGPSRAAGATGGATTSGGTETSILHFNAGKMVRGLVSVLHLLQSRFLADSMRLKYLLTVWQEHDAEAERQVSGGAGCAAR